MIGQLIAEFLPQVMKLKLPIPGSRLQACFSDPYSVHKKVSDRDYLIATLDQNHRSRLCHVITLKAYHGREAEAPGCVASKSCICQLCNVLYGAV